MQGRSSSTWHVLSGAWWLKEHQHCFCRDTGIGNCELRIANCKKGKGETQRRRETRLVELSKSLGRNG